MAGPTEAEDCASGRRMQRRSSTIRLGTSLRLALLMGWLAVSPCLRAQVEPDSVCQILGNLELYSGQEVRVRAEIDSGGSLIARDCPVEIRVGTFRFSNTIDVAWPGSMEVRDNRVSVPFVADDLSRALFRVGLEARRGRNPRFSATIEGLIVTRQPPLAGLVLAWRENIQWGFGHLQAPAMIVIRRFSQVVVSRELDDGTRETTELTGADPVSRNIMQSVRRREQEAIWSVLKSELTKPDGRGFFESQLKGTLIPGDFPDSLLGGKLQRLRLRGLVVSATPAKSPELIVIAVMNKTTPEATLKLSVPLNRPLPKGSEVEFEGIPETLAFDPFMITFRVPPAGLIVLEGGPAPPLR